MLERFLYYPTGPWSWRSSLHWWERRRLVYNLLVAAAGLLTIGVCAATTALTANSCGVPDSPVFLLLGILGYGIAANLAYTGGWLCECLLHKFLSPQQLAPPLMLAGLAFSLLLTLSPAAFVPLGCALSDLPAGSPLQ